MSAPIPRPLGDTAPTTVAGAFVDTLRRHAERPALVMLDGTTMSYAQLGDRVRVAVSVLRTLGCGPGERIAIWLPNVHEWPVLEFAAALLGLLIVPVNTRFRAGEAEYVLRLSGARVLFTQHAFMTNGYVERLRELANGPLGRGEEASIPALPALRRIVLVDDHAGEPGTVRWSQLADAAGPVSEDLDALARQRTPQDRLWIFWTSGSTSAPKGAVLTQSAVTNVWNWSSMAGYRPDDRVLVSRPYFYIAGNFWCLLAPMLHGAAAVVGQQFTPEEIVERCARERVTVLSGNPLLLKGVVDDPAYDAEAFRQVRFGYFGGSTVSLTDLARIRDRIGFDYLLQPYGMTELEGFATSTHPDDPLEIVFGTVGRPLPGIEMRLTDPETGSPVTRGQSGELWTRGRGLVDYEGVSDADRARLFDADGWFRTGDLLRLRDDDRYEFVGRAKDLIKVGGENVTAGEIEAKLMEHPDIANAAVVPRVDERRGEVPLAFVETRSGAPLDADALRAWCRERMAPFKVPVRFVEIARGAWPMTATNKIAKHQLQE
ncbi:MAG: class I adenylate-forming enzyme family protein [Burkholderiaceae bacterium]